MMSETIVMDFRIAAMANLLVIGHFELITVEGHQFITIITLSCLFIMLFCQIYSVFSIAITKVNSFCNEIKCQIKYFKFINFVCKNVIVVLNLKCKIKII